MAGGGGGGAGAVAAAACASACCLAARSLFEQRAAGSRFGLCGLSRRFRLRLLAERRRGLVAGFGEFVLLLALYRDDARVFSGLRRFSGSGHHHRHGRFSGLLVLGFPQQVGRLAERIRGILVGARRLRNLQRVLRLIDFQYLLILILRQHG